MTEEGQERITRRISSPIKFEYYELQYIGVVSTAEHFEEIIKNMEYKVSLVRDIIGEPSKDPEPQQQENQEDKPKAPTEFTYWTEEGDIIFSVPFVQKDPFKKLVKDISGRWPSWLKERLLWKLEEGLFSVKLQTQIVEQFMGGKA